MSTFPLILDPKQLIKAIGRTELSSPLILTVSLLCARVFKYWRKKQQQNNNI